QRAGHPDRPRQPGRAGAPGRLTARAFAALAAGALLALAPTPALAHAALVGADPAPGAVLPAPPAAITLHFSEAVTGAAPGIGVRAPWGRPARPSGARAEGARLTSAFRDTAPGTYLVTWQVIAADTHPSRGQFTFSVGLATSPPAGEQLGGDVGA